MATATVNIRAELAGLRQDLQSAGDLTEGQAQAMVISLEKRLKAAEKASRAASKAANDTKAAERELARVAKEADKALADQHRGIEALGKAVAEQFGGPISKLADLSTSTAGAVGAVGAAGFAAVAGVGALAAGAKRLADAAVEARDRLTEQGLAAAIPPSAAASLADYETAGQTLRNELDLLTVTIGSGLAGAIGDAANVTADLLAGFRDLANAAEDANTELGGFTVGARNMVRIGQAIGSLGLSELYRSVASEAGAAADEQERLADSARDAATAYEKMLEEIPFYGPTADDLEKGGAKIAEAERKAAEAARAHEKAAREDAAALREQQRAAESHARAQEEEKLQLARAAHEARLHAEALEANIKAARDLQGPIDDLRTEIGGLERSWAGSSSALEMALDVWTGQLEGFLDSPIVGKIGEIAGDLADLFVAANEREIESLEDRHTRQMDAFEAEREARRRSIDEWLQGEEDRIDALLGYGELSENEAQNERKRLLLELQAKKDAAAEATRDAKEQLEQQHEHELELAKKAFRQNQSLQLAQAAIESIRAGISLIPAFASLPPPVSFGAPAMAAGLAATSFAIAAAGIKSQKPPEFPMGFVPPSATSTSGSPDHLDARIRRDEAVAAPRTTQQIGPLIDALNRGMPMPSGPIVIQLDGRTIATHLADRHGRSQPTPGSWSAGRRPLYGAR